MLGDGSLALTPPVIIGAICEIRNGLVATVNQGPKKRLDCVVQFPTAGFSHGGSQWVHTIAMCMFVCLFFYVLLMMHVMHLCYYAKRRDKLVFIFVNGQKRGNDMKGETNPFQR